MTLRTAVIGAGHLGREHARIHHALSMEGKVEFVAVCDINRETAQTVAARTESPYLTDWRELLAGRCDAVSLAVPTESHCEIACGLLSAGIHVLVEKPISRTLEEADRMIAAANAGGASLQVGHAERFNPALVALHPQVRNPVYFEIHRVGQFTARSLDIDVVLDLMIHDADIVLALAAAEPQEIRAAGVSILSPKVDIANVRLQFPNGCVANLTASRISTEKVRKLRLFQPHQYLSLDYARQDLAVFSVGEGRKIGFEQALVTKGEPLKLQLEAFLDSITTRIPAKSSGETARRSLRVAMAILDKIKEHSEIVSRSLVTGWKP